VLRGYLAAWLSTVLLCPVQLCNCATVPLLPETSQPHDPATPVTA